MILSLATTHQPATDLGYLLHKNPARAHEFSLNYGQATVFFSEASEARCEACLAVELDPIELVRGSPQSWSLAQYVNDRPYAASSLLSTAISEVFGTALNGRCRDKPELVTQTLPWEVTIACLPSLGGEARIRGLFEPLGYTLEVTKLPLDEKFPEWGESPYFRVRLQIEARLEQLLQHLYVLIPVLDKFKHYFVSEQEIDKLLAKGQDWLLEHPERDWITARYLKFQRRLTRKAQERWSELEAQGEQGDEEEDEEAGAEKGASAAEAEERLEKPLNLHQQRLASVLSVLKSLPVSRVADLGCGEGKLLRQLIEHSQFQRIVGMDVSSRSLEKAKSRLRLERMAEKKRARLELILGSLTYRDRRWEGVDAVTLVEVIEHLDENRLQTVAQILFGIAKPAFVILTTPNAEYNAKFESLPAGKFRHPDHRFEWTREECASWAKEIEERFAYQWEQSQLGEVDEALGGPSQMLVFRRGEQGLSEEGLGKESQSEEKGVSN